MSERLHRGKPVVKPGAGRGFSATSRALSASGLPTVCQEAHCPNKAECWGASTATFLLLGSYCTRGCGFCSVTTSDTPPPPEPDEPQRVVAAAAQLGLRYVVLTSVTRDDLADGGAGTFAAAINALKHADPTRGVEVLTPDYRGPRLSTVLNAAPDVFAHNVETVERLTPELRHPAFSYRKSLSTLREAATLSPAIPVKSSLMLGLGETFDEVRKTLEELREAGATLLALGQYLQPAREKRPVVRYLAEEEFAGLREAALALGFTHVASGPLVRASYKAHEALEAPPP